MAEKEQCKHEWVQVCGEAVCKSCDKYIGACFVDVERKDCLGLEDEPTEKPRVTVLIGALVGSPFQGTSPLRMTVTTTYRPPPYIIVV